MIPYCSICWDVDKVKLLDQRRLPKEEIYLEITDFHEIIEAIRTLAIRGTPAIGVAAAMGAALGALSLETSKATEFQSRFQDICREIAAARPTAVNLFWALDRMLLVAQDHAAESVAAIQAHLVTEAQTMLKEDETINRRMAQEGQALIHGGQRILTHCNTGALATGAYGTTLGVLRGAWEVGKRFSVWVDENSPPPPGRPPHHLGTGEIGHPLHPDPRWRRGHPHAPGESGPGDSGGGPHCGQRRHRQ